MAHQGVVLTMDDVVRTTAGEENPSWAVHWQSAYHSSATINENNVSGDCECRQMSDNDGVR